MDEICEEIVRLLKHREWRVVFAESCTGGLVSATLARMPGVSEHLCGSAVTYRNRTKQDWLDIPPTLLAEPGPVSGIVARCMAEGVLKMTPEAHVAVSITGHLGPDAPAELDGLVYIGTAHRGDGDAPSTGVGRYHLRSDDRLARQQEAAEHAFNELRSLLSNTQR